MIHFVFLFLAGTPWLAQGGAALPGRDFHGDPLPRGAVARLGTLRFQPAVDGHCTALAWSPDGNYLASGLLHAWRDKGTWYLWDRQGKVLFRGPLGEVVPSAIAFNAAGNKAAILAEHLSRGVQLLEVWDIPSGSKRETIHLGEGSAQAVVFGPENGALLLVGMSGRTITVRDARTKTVVRSWEAHKKPVRQLSLSGAGRFLTSQDEDGGVRLWETATGKLVRVMKAGWWTLQTSFLQAWHDKAQCRLLRIDDGKLFLLDGVTGATLRTFAAGRFTVATFAPDGQSFVAASQAGALRRWECATGKEIAPAHAAGAGVVALSLSPGGRYVAATYGGPKNWLRIWSVATGKLVREHELGEFGCHAFAPDGAFAFLAGARLFLARSAADPRPREFDKPTHRQHYRLRFAPDGKTLCSNSCDGVQRWDVARGKRLPLTDPFKVWARRLEFAPGGERLALDDRSQVCLVELSAGLRKTVLHEGTNPEDTWQAFAFASPTRLLVANAFRPTVRLLALPAGTELRRWEWTVEFSRPGCALSPRNGPLVALPHGQMAVHVPRGSRALLLQRENVTNRSDVLRLLDLTTGGVRHELDPRQGDQLTLALSPDGRYLASAGADGNVLVWDLYQGAVGGGELAVETCWELLTSAPAPKAYRAVCGLVNRPEPALKLFRDKLVPAAAAPDARQLAGLVGRLENPVYRIRQDAYDRLRKLHRQAIPALRQALAKSSTLEGRRRIEQLLEQTEMDTPDQVRVRRALEVLAMMRHAGAREVLQSLARGAADAFPTQEAAAALRRLPE